MSGLRQSLDNYLTLRRSLGYKLDDARRVLRSFVAFAEQAGAGTISTELAVRWATQPVNASPIWLAHRLSAVRGFARYLRTIDHATEIPPTELLSAPGYRPAPPYLYSDADVTALMAAARRLTPPLRSATFETLLGLLAVTGLRLGEEARPRRHRLGRRAVHRAEFEIRPVAGGGMPRQHHRRAVGLQRSPRSAVSLQH